MILGFYTGDASRCQHRLCFGTKQSLFLLVPPRELGKERIAKAGRGAVCEAAEAERKKALEPSGGTLTLLGIISYTGNMAQLPHHQ